jgi:hypothetical protein
VIRRSRFVLATWCFLWAVPIFSQEIEQSLAGLKIRVTTFEDAQKILGKTLRKNLHDAKMTRYQWFSRSCGIDVWVENATQTVIDVRVARYLGPPTPPKSPFCERLRTGRGLGLWDPTRMATFYYSNSSDSWFEDELTQTFRSPASCTAGQRSVMARIIRVVASGFVSKLPIPPGGPGHTSTPGEIESIELLDEKGSCDHGVYKAP